MVGARVTGRLAIARQSVQHKMATKRSKPAVPPTAMPTMAPVEIPCPGLAEFVGVSAVGIIDCSGVPDDCVLPAPAGPPVGFDLLVDIEVFSEKGTSVALVEFCGFATTVLELFKAFQGVEERGMGHSYGQKVMVYTGGVVPVVEQVGALPEFVKSPKM
jgi:hypothetical protein